MSAIYNDPTTILNNNPQKMMKKSNNENKIKRIKRFSKILEKNINNYMNMNINFDPSRVIRGLYLKIDSINGIKKIFPKEKLIPGRKYFLRFFVTFYNTNICQFLGNTYKSLLLSIRFNETGHYELNERDPLYVYFLSDSSDSKNGIFAILEILFVETSEDLRIISQTCEGWGMLDLNETPIGKMGTPIQIYSGTPRNLMHKSSKNFLPINGASIIYSCNAYKELLILRFLLPTYTLIGNNDILPGLLMKTLPLRPVLNEPLKLTQFFDVFLKNAEIEISPTMENGILEFSRKYRAQKYDIPISVNLSPILIKERKLKIGIHNTYSFINSNGMQNSISLTKKENTLFFKGVSHVDNYFIDELCAFIFELNYLISMPIMNNKEDFLNLIIGYAIYIPKKIDMTNKYKTLKLITGIGNTVYGESLFEALDSKDRIFKFNFILSKNKDTYDKTYKEKEIEKLKLEMSEIQKTMQEEYTKQLLNEKLKFDKERDDMLKRMQFELEEKESRLRESQRSLKAVYDIEDNQYDKNYKRSQENAPINNFNNIKHNQVEANANNFDPNQSQQIPNVNFLKNPNQTATNFNINQFNNTNANNNNLFHEEQMNIGDNLLPDRKIDDDNYNLNMNVQNNPKSENLQNIQVNQIKVDEQTANLNYNSANASNNRYDQTQSNFNNSGSNFANINNNTNEVKSHFYNTDNNILLNKNNINPNNFPQEVYNTASPGLFYNSHFPAHLNDVNLMNPHINNQNQFMSPNNIGISPELMGNMQKNFYNTVAGNNFIPNHNLILENPTRDISRREKAELTAKGILNMQITEKSLSLLNYTFENELKDDKKSNIFLISFLAYKPLENIKDYKSVPNKIHFKFDFWDFSTFITKSAIINKPSSDIIPSNTPLVITREGVPLTAKTEEKEMKIQIEYDPSVSDNNIDFRDFINYLLNKNLFVEIYESEKLNQIGHIKIPLKDFLRQGKQTIFHTKEYDIFDYNFIHKGSIQVLIKTIGCNCSKTFNYDPHHLKVINTKDKFSNTNKKKKVKTSQIKLEKLSEINKENLAKAIIEKAENSNASNLLKDKNEQNDVLIKGLKLNLDPETQKRLRTLKYTNKPNSEGVNNPLSILKLNKLEELKNKEVKENEFIKSLSYVNKIKEQSKKDIIEKTLQENNKNIVTLDLIAGQNHYFNFIIQNMENYEELVQVVITKQNKTAEADKNNIVINPKDDMETENVVSLVTNPEEWQNYVENNKLYKTNDYNMISPQNYLIMRPMESIPLLFKIKSFNLHLKDETFAIWIYKKEGQPLYNLYLSIRKVFPIIDHNYIYYLPENRISTVKFPNPFKFDKSKILKFLDFYQCSNPHVTLSLDTVSNEFSFKYKTNAEFSESSFYLYIFLDEGRANLYGTWKFDIYAVHNIDVHAQIGSKVIHKLSIDDRNARTVQFYSTIEEILYLPEKYNKPMVLIPNLTNEIRCVINPKHNDVYEILMNCVDISSRELVKSWLFRVTADKPDISHVHKIDCKINQVLNFKYEFGNPLNNHMIFNFESNSPLLKIIDTRLPFNGGEKKLLNISIPPQSQVGRVEVLMFVSDLEELYSETILFQLNFN